MSNDLNQLQTNFKEYLFTGANEVEMLDCIAERNSIPAQQRLDVYRNAYYIRLQEAIAHDYPTLLAIAGDGRFGELVTRYIKSHPSTSPSLREFGRALPRWLQTHREYALADVAATEWAVLEAFDAADAEPLCTEAVVQVPVEEWEELAFVFHPSISFLPVSCNVRDCWSAVRNREAHVPELQPSNQEYLAVWRTNKGPAILSIDDATYKVLSLLQQGHRFGDCCMALSKAVENNRTSQLAATALAFACNNGWIVAIK